jgi:D-inositol-3-phosphate glycosyltransferase
MFHTVGAVKNSTVGSEKEPELRTAIEKYLARKCDRILVATDRERGHLVQHYGACSETIGVVPCGVNLDLFRPLDKAAARQQLGFAQDESVVLFVGRFAPLKGIDKLLAAMAHLKHYQQLRLVIVGGDGNNAPESQRLQGLSRELSIQDSVTFVGRIEQSMLPPYYSAADVLVVPSHYESFGLVALESLASGTPVVATRVGAMESILREGETGHVVNNGFPRLLANGIETFISGSNGLSADEVRASVLRFSWANVKMILTLAVADKIRLIRSFNVNTAVDVLVITAHPDDAEFGVAGTVARWTREGKQVVYVKASSLRCLH